MSVSDLLANEPLPSPPMSWREKWRTVVVLFKLRIVFLLLFSAIGGAFLAARGWPGGLNLLLLIVTGGSAAAGASAINQYWEREKDKQMNRTQTRPLAAGSPLNPQVVLGISLALIFIPSLLVWPWRPYLAIFNLAGAFIYVVIYTIWLKPRTLLNIVIGGAAGSAAVLSGGGAVLQPFDPALWALAAIMFLWTPSHFWSLAILYKEDYARSATPMLPTKTSPRTAAWWVLSHTGPTALGATALAILPELGWLYFWPVAAASVYIFWCNFQLIHTPEKPQALRLFLTSNVYLVIVFSAIITATAVSNFS